MRPKRLISLLVAVCMMITMLPLSAVTAFATDTSTVHEANDDEGIYRYAYKKNEDGETVTITKFLGPVDPTNNGPYVITIPTTLDKYTVTGIGKWAFDRCGLHTLTIEGPIESMGLAAFYECTKLETISFGENIKTIGEQAFQGCSSLTKVTIPDSVTSIGEEAFYECTKLETISFGENIETIGRWAFTGCSALTNVTIPKNVTTIESGTFKKCSKLEYIILPAGLTSFKDSLTGCPAGNPNGAIYYKNYKAKADALLADNDNNPKIDANGKLRKRNFLYLCKVTFDANGGKTDYPEVPVYKTEKITETIANDLTAIPKPTRTGYNFIGWYTEDGKRFYVKDTAITDDITLHAGWEFDPNALVCHPLTVTGGIVTVKKGDKDVTDTLTVTTDEATGKKTYSVPEGATVTVTLDKTLVPEGMVFDIWSTGKFSLPLGQDYKAESITFPMSSDVVDIAAQYRDAAADHTPATAVCHPLTVTGGIVTVKKDGQPLVIDPVVTGDKKTYSVPDGATVTVTLDKTPIPEDMVFDSWSTGNLSLPLGQDYKAETITFPMSSDANIAAQYRDASIEDDGPNVLGTAAIIGTAAVGTAVLGYQAYSLGTEFAGKLMALPYFPSNRSALAMMLWEDAGKPMPESELLYPDVEQEEQDMDLQHAARWAMENELIPDLNDEGTAPEEMKFFPANPVSKLDVLNAWQKAQELKNN
ncbi:leucine-rich repeat protein [Faecalibacterium duncaniae]|uniref:leucine-rich repeat protein n=1 Tax=Faecalibacterium duncaniae (strain DSM 17677 / JCM 31915 / A2-165) TaxID=411483 RepID=UPI002941307B|nr:leucine-rich repeat protein [Faecalibacterium duncaniae]MDV5094414.1 leucine-rich repeat protein [Faecalibacterium duncaniae]